ncbi:MAG: NAD(P)H-hydrate dehydratase [Saprospiraceae bacterium]|nr:NAD(P)H-hydrate dehydratase [Saprospiraceae bacterium]
MKIYNTAQIKAYDEFTILHEPISSIDLMERAAVQLTKKLLELYPLNTNFSFIIGNGNNGGDGLAMARLLHPLGMNLKIFLLNFANSKLSKDAEINLKRLPHGIKIIEVKNPNDFDAIEIDDLIIDCIFGTGLKYPLRSEYHDFIQSLNQRTNQMIAIDIPSGLTSDDNNNLVIESPVIKAHTTITIQQPKFNFFFAENNPFVGEWHVVDINLDKDYYENTPTNNHLIDRQLIHHIHKKREKFGHKGSYGHSLIVAGEFGKMGAAVLATKSCLRSGSGLVSSYIPKCGYDILQISVPEAMIIISDHFSKISNQIDISKYDAIGIGPGIGISEESISYFKHLLPQVKQPIVIDADALNIIANDIQLLDLLPALSILTPHPKEFDRIFGQSNNGFERCEKQRICSQRHKIIIILKGAHTSISFPDGSIYFNQTGNVGMATGGSGDTLTGIITGLLSQKYTPQEASILGVFLHGLAGDMALSSQSVESLIATDIIDNLGNAYKNIQI